MAIDAEERRDEPQRTTGSNHMPFTQSLLLTLWIAFGLYTSLVVLFTKDAPPKGATLVARLVYWHGFVFIAVIVIHAAWFLLQIVARYIQADIVRLG